MSTREEILEELTSSAASFDDVDLARADRLIGDRLGEARYAQDSGYEAMSARTDKKRSQGKADVRP